MYVKVRTMDGSKTAHLTISRLTSVKDFRKLVEENFNVLPERQRLFFSGKQMVDDGTLFDYGVKVNDVIQLMITPVPVLSDISSNILNEKLSRTEQKAEESLELKENKSSKYYQVGDLVDAKTINDGSWWESEIEKIVYNPPTTKKSLSNDDFDYFVKYVSDDCIEKLCLSNIRPRARKITSLEKLKPGHVVMVNYNIENPEKIGFWYDCQVTKTINTRSSKIIIGTIQTADNNTIEDCHVTFLDEIFKIEKNIPIEKRIGNEKTDVPADIRAHGTSCKNCNDNPKKKCKECGCHECGGKENPNQQLMCDECDQPFHIYCLDPPLEDIPEVEEWFCPLCKNDDTEIVKAGEKLKTSKKRSKMFSSTSKSSRDWGKGFACAARQKICDLVPTNHFGPVPGVEVGSSWLYRLQVSEDGIHRPHVAGIAGREAEGAFSVVLAGGYEDDEDRGEEFTYTGSGGRDLSGNKRTADQSSDQLLTKMNKALAMNCNVPLNKKGAEAEDWKGGKPLRVVRNWKGRKHSEYAPTEGNRYDGIYKIVKYWQATGKSRFKVWRYLFKRDDSIPAPWTSEGQERIKELGLEMKFPAGYEEASKAAKKKKEESFIASSDEEEGEQSKKRGKKRKSLGSESTPVAKRSKVVSFEIESDIKDFIETDSKNKKTWDVCIDAAKEGKAKFVSAIEDKFLCICCQVLVFNPVTTPCAHNVCKSCLQRSFKADVFTCPSCRHELGREFEMSENIILLTVLKSIFPGYEAGRS